MQEKWLAKEKLIMFVKIYRHRMAKRFLHLTWATWIKVVKCHYLLFEGLEQKIRQDILHVIAYLTALLSTLEVGTAQINEQFEEIPLEQCRAIHHRLQSDKHEVVIAISGMHDQRSIYRRGFGCFLI